MAILLTDCKNLVAIDPGINGGVALAKRDPSGMLWGIVTAFPLPQVPAQLAEELSNISRGGETVVVVEDVHSMPAQGVASSFKFGRGLGRIEGVVAALKLRLEYLQPSAWTRTATGKTRSDFDGLTAWKRHLLEVATAAHPNLRPTLKTADAILMARHIIIQFSGRAQ